MQVYAEKSSVGPDATGIPVTTDANGNVIRSPQIPRTLAQTTVLSRSGQTIVLGGLISENVTKLKDKVPVLGDLPIAGVLFRSESSATSKKNLMIFVTTRIIDPAGNRFHSEDEMPFAQTGIPVQKPVVVPVP